MDAEACSTTMDVNLAPPEEMTIQDNDNEKLVVVECDNDYMRTAPAILCFLQVVSEWWGRYNISISMTMFRVCCSKCGHTSMLGNIMEINIFKAKS